MLNTDELEKRWLKYKIRSYIPYIIICLSLLIITIVTYIFLFDFDETKQKVVKSIINDKETPIKVPVKQIIKVEIPSNNLTESTDKVKLVPSLDFMIKMQNSSQLNRPTMKETKSSFSPNNEFPQTVKHLSQDNIIQENIEEFTQELVSDTEKTVNIERKNTQQDIYEIIKRFKKNNNPVLSLFIAKKYYELKNYKQAYNYALITNEINKDIDESWIIFTRSLVKLGKKDAAINILNQYIEHSHSNSAKILIKEIRSGKFQ